MEGIRERKEIIDEEKPITLGQLEKCGFSARETSMEISQELKTKINQKVDNLRKEIAIKYGLEEPGENDIKEVFENWNLEDGDNQGEVLLTSLLEKLNKVADRDNKLTRLYTREAGLYSTARMIKDAEEENGLSFINTDIDYFQSSNNAVGHEFGNWELLVVADKLLANAENSMRVGGEELSMATYPKEFGGEGTTSSYANSVREQVKIAVNKMFDEFNQMYEDDAKLRDTEVEEDFDVRNELNWITLEERADALEDQFKNNEEAQKAVKELFDAGIIDERKIAEMLKVLLDPPHPQAKQRIDSMQDDEVLQILGEYRGRFKLENGTITLGALTVDFKGGKDKSYLNERDLSLIYQRVNGEKEFVSKVILHDVFSDCTQMQDDGIVFNEKITYYDFRRKILKYGEEKVGKGLLEEDRDQLYSLIDGLYRERAARFLNQANVIQEEQKIYQKNSVGYFDPDNLDKEIPSNEIEGAREGIKGDPRFVADFQEIFKETKRQSELVARDEEGEAVLINDVYKRKIRLAERLARRYIEKSGADKQKIDELLIRLKEECFNIQQRLYVESLTSVKNGYYFDEIIVPKINNVIRENKKEENLEKKQSFSVCALDFDNLRAVNNVGGHIMGDIVLLKTTQFIQDKLNDEEYIREKCGISYSSDNSKPELVRMTGGEEFVITFSGIDESTAIRIMQEINKELKVEIDEYLKSYEISFAQQGEDEPSTDSLYNHIKEYIRRNDPRRSSQECEKFGTITSGIVDVKNLDIEDLTGGAVRRLADELGEMLKGKRERVRANDGYSSPRGKTRGLSQHVHRVAA